MLSRQKILLCVSFICETVLALVFIAKQNRKTNTKHTQEKKQIIALNLVYESLTDLWIKTEFIGNEILD